LSAQKQLNSRHLDLLEDIGDYACRLLANFPSLLLFAEDLSTENLVQWTSIVQSEPCAGKPVRPPDKFLLEVKRVVSQKAWIKLNTLVEKWETTTKSEVRKRLGVYEQEYLSMGLLWQTLLITECKRRNDQIQEEIAAVRAIDLT
jgi:hypothetical protein